MKICTIAFRSIHTQKYLQWLVKRGHEVHWISENPEAIDGVEIWDIRKAAAYFSFSSRLRRAGKQIGRVIYIRKALKQIRPDIFHLHTLYYPSFLGVFTGYHPLVISPWNGDVLWSKKRPHYHRFIVKQALKKADALTADNDIMKKGLLDYGVSGKKINTILWYGVDSKLFRPKERDENLRSKLKITNGPVVLSMRSLEPGYNIDKIIRSIPLVTGKYPNVTYLFGWQSGQLEHEYRSLASELGVEERVRFIGEVPYEEIPNYYSIADISLSVASPDSTPATLLESMACGVPIIVSAEKAITEFVKDGINGDVVAEIEPMVIAEKISKLLADHERKERYAVYNRKLVMQIADLDTEMQKLENIYQSLLKE